jgi:hypothetical protein
MRLRITKGMTISAAFVVVSIGFGAGVNALTHEFSQYNEARLVSNTALIQDADLTAKLTTAVNSAQASATAGKADDLAPLAAKKAAADKALAELATATKSCERAIAANTVTGTYLPWAYSAATENIRAASTGGGVQRAERALAALTAAQAAVDAQVAAKQAAEAVTAASAKASVDAAAGSAALAAKARAVTAPPINWDAVSAAVPQQKSVTQVATPTQPASPSAHDAAGAGSPYNVVVRVSLNATALDNGQSAIDAGGQVAMNYRGYGTDVISHVSNDSTALKLMVGDIVNFSGAISGSYRVTGYIDVLRNSSLAQLGQLNAHMFMQTCHYDPSLQMRVAGLVSA